SISDHTKLEHYARRQVRVVQIRPDTVCRQRKNSWKPGRRSFCATSGDVQCNDSFVRHQLQTASQLVCLCPICGRQRDSTFQNIRREERRSFRVAEANQEPHLSDRLCLEVRQNDVGCGRVHHPIRKRVLLISRSEQ